MTTTAERPSSSGSYDEWAPPTGDPAGGPLTDPSGGRGWGNQGWGGRRSERQPPAQQWVDASPGAQATSILLFMVFGILIFLLINLVFVSQIQHYTAQKALYSELRLSLAQGSTPVSPVLKKGGIVTPGTPVAVMNAPSVGVSREVIVEGTASGETMKGIGHSRDTVLPCQVGSSVLMARSGAYGGVGSKWSRLKVGDRFDVTMGQGSCTYEVEGHRSPGDPGPAAPTGRESHLTLMTAAGVPYMPTEVLRIDATIVSKAFNRPSSSIPSAALPSSERAMGNDTSNLFALVLLLEALIGVAIGATWLWHRWGRWQTWLVAGPVGLVVALGTASSLDFLLPNLL